MRRKIYLRIGGVLLIAVVVTVVVAQTVVVEDSGWTGGILALVLSVVGILVLSGVAVGALLEGLVFSKITKLTEQVRILEGTSTEQERRSLAETLEELQTRHSDLETAYCQLQQLQEASASLGSSLDISDALVQLEEVALGIFDADEVWLLRLEPDRQRLAGMRAFSHHPEGYSRLPAAFGCWGPQASISVEQTTMLRSVLEDDEPVFIDSVTEMSTSEVERLFDGVPPELGGFHSLVAVPLAVDDHPVGVAISASALPTRFTADRRSTILLFAGRVARALENNRLYEKDEVKIQKIKEEYIQKIKEHETLYLSSKRSDNVATGSSSGTCVSGIPA